MRILLAGPGTGKTTKIGSLLDQQPDASKVLVLSFTNVTVNDLKNDLGSKGLNDRNCMTLHKFAVKYNHDRVRYVLNLLEVEVLEQIADQIETPFDELCDFLGCTTFDQMIVRFVTFARANPAYLQEKLSGFTTLIVDEYQDFNPAEQTLIDLLIEQIQDSYVLGDDDQCIYDFKDASSDRIIELHRTHPSLEHEHKCYRCPDTLVERASRLIGNNKKRVKKQWELSGKKGTVSYRQFPTSDKVASHVTSAVQQILAETEKDQILILSPVRFAVKELVAELESNGVDFRNHFAGSLPQSLVELCWKLRALFGRHRYLNLVLIGYRLIQPRKKLYSLLKLHIERGKDLQELWNLLQKKLPSEMLQTYEGIEDALAQPAFAELAPLFAEAQGENENEKLEKLLVSKEEIPPTARVQVMSIHRSKGLGAEHIFMVGLTEGIIPNLKEGTDSIEASRRLFYVGMTRAKKHLHLISLVHISPADANKVNKGDFKYKYKTKTYVGRASRFIAELGSF